MGSEEVRLGVMGGTFNPIHNGHLFAAEEARQSFSLSKIIFVPSFIPPHKTDVFIANPEDRFMMVTLATISNPYFIVSDIELRRGGTSFTKDTIQEYRRLYGVDAKIFFIVGADTIQELDTWRDIDDLLKMCKFIATSRGGYKLELTERYKGIISTLELPAFTISSTDIRHRLSTGRSIRYLVPEGVENYIYKNKLYIK